MREPTRLYEIREVDGLRTVAEYSRLYAFQAVEKLEALGVDNASEVVGSAGESGFAAAPGVAVLASEV